MNVVRIRVRHMDSKVSKVYNSNADSVPEALRDVCGFIQRKHAELGSPYSSYKMIYQVVKGS